MSDVSVHTFASMGTVVTLEVVGHEGDAGARPAREAVIQRAVAWFERIDDDCTRFDAESELRQLSTQIGAPVAVSALLFEAVRFALAVAEETGGAFDPTVGQPMEARGFDREYRSGQIVRTTLEADDAAGPASYRDVHLDLANHTITLRRPLVLDLGAVAKGLAVDLAARELAAFTHFAIDAGGDLYLGGCNAGGGPWSIGIRHPRDEGQLLHTLRVTNAAVCTSGDYERRNARGEHHIMDARTGTPTAAAASVTVIADSAMVADALATAAFALGPSEGLALLNRHGVDGLIVTPALERFETPGVRCDVYRGRRTTAAISDR